MADPAIALTDVRFQWGTRRGFSLSCPTLVLPSGSSTLLLGASGSGKSTLLSLICGVVAAESGMIDVANTDIASLKPGARDRFRAEQIGVIFQQFNLLPYANVEDNIRLPLRFAPKRRARAAGGISEAARLCRSLGLPDDVLKSRAGKLSVGQQQRVAVARALIGRPPIIIADEPTSALDAASQDSFMQLLFDQVAQAGASLMMASHDERLGARFDQVLRLEDIATVQRPQS